MRLNLITFCSNLGNQASVYESHKTLIDKLKEKFEVSLTAGDEALPQEGHNLLFIASGGTEWMVKEAVSRLPHPALLLTDGAQNSLAAAIEINAWMQQQRLPCRILHGTPQGIVEQLEALYSDTRAPLPLAGKRIAVMGHPSPWLIAGEVDYEAAHKRWGVEFCDIPLERVIDYYEEAKGKEAAAIAQNFEKRACDCIEPDKREIVKAARLYMAVKRICSEEGAHAVTLNCFGIIGPACTTGCMALALLNEEDIPAACEGDIPMAFTLLAAKCATGKTGFQFNPARIDRHTNRLIAAHCTIAPKLTGRYIIRNHFETGRGVAIQGILPPEEVTLLRVSGRGLDEYFVSRGRILRNTDNEEMCRTQVEVELDRSVSYFLNRPLGNHHVLLPENEEKELKNYFSMVEGMKDF